MSRLTTEELRSRLALDYRAMRSLRGPALGRVEAYASALDMGPRREASDAEGLRGLATAYRVEFRFRMLLSADRELRAARAVFAVPAHGYPFAAPRVHFEPGAVPFSPHVQAESGFVCLGDAWSAARGHWLLANLVVHVMRLANFDEPCTRDGFSHEAVAYANGILRGRPLNPGLDYPVLDERVTHSGAAPGAPAVLDAPASLFRPSSGFAARRPPGPADAGFRRRDP